MYENLKSLDTTDAKVIQIDKGIFWDSEEIVDVNSDKVTGEDFAALDTKVTAFIAKLEKQEAARVEADNKAKEAKKKATEQANIAAAEKKSKAAIATLEKDIASAQSRLDTIEDKELPQVEKDLAYNNKTHGPDHAWTKGKQKQLQDLKAEKKKLTDKIAKKQQQIAEIKACIKSGVYCIPDLTDDDGSVKKTPGTGAQPPAANNATIEQIKGKVAQAGAPLLSWHKRSYINGAFEDHIKILQTFLKAKGFYSGPIDGDYAGGTKRAVEAYQRSGNGSMTVDGSVGPETWAHIIKADPNVLEQLKCCAVAK